MHTEPPLKGLVGSAELNLGAEAAELLQVVQCPQDPELGTSLCKGPTSSPLKNWADIPPCFLETFKRGEEEVAPPICWALSLQLEHSLRK